MTFLCASKYVYSAISKVLTISGVTFSKNIKTIKVVKLLATVISNIHIKEIYISIDKENTIWV